MSLQSVEQLFQTARGLESKERKKLLEKALDYCRRYSKRKLSIEKLRQIENRAVPNQGDKIMPPLKCSLEIEREEGRKEMVLKLLAAKMDMNLICQVTGLSKEEIEALTGQK